MAPCVPLMAPCVPLMTPCVPLSATGCACVQVLSRWLSEAEDPTEIFEGRVCCSWGNTWHEIFRCECTAVEEMNGFTDDAGKAHMCDASYRSAIRKMFTASLVRWRHTPFNGLAETGLSKGRGGASPTKAVRELMRLIGVFAKYMNTQVQREIATLFVRANCEPGLRAFTNRIAIQHEPTNREHHSMPNPEQPLSDNGRKVLHALATAQGALHCACLQRHVEVSRLLLSVLEGAELCFLRRAVVVDGCSSGAIADWAAGGGSDRPSLSSAADGAVTGAPESFKGKWMLTPLLSVLAGPSSVLKGGALAEDALADLPPSSTRNVCPLIKLLIEHKANVDAVALHEGVEGASLPFPPLTLTAREPRLDWEALVLRPQQDEYACEAFDILMRHATISEDRREVLQGRMRCRTAESRLASALTHPAKQGDAYGAVHEWCAQVVPPDGTEPWFDWPKMSAGTSRLLDEFVSALKDEESSVGVLTALCERARCPPNLRLASGSTMLLRAAAANRIAMAKVLLDAKADCLQQRTLKTKDTALHVAVSASNLELVELLLMYESGLRCLDERNADGKAPLDCVDKSRKSASAASAKKIRALLAREVAKRAKEAKEGADAQLGAKLLVERRAASAAMDATFASNAAAVGAELGSSTGKAELKRPASSPNVEADTQKENQISQPPPSVSATPAISAASALQQRILTDHTAATRREVESLLAQALVHQASPDFLRVEVGGDAVVGTPQLAPMLQAVVNESSASAPAAAPTVAEAVEAATNEATEAVEAATNEATEAVEAATNEATEAVEAATDEATEAVEAVINEATEAVSVTGIAPPSLRPVSAAHPTSLAPAAQPAPAAPAASAAGSAPPAPPAPPAAAPPLPTRPPQLSSSSPTHAGAPSPTTAPQWLGSFDGLFEHHPWRVLIVRAAPKDL